jgi:putative transposase
MIGVRPDGTKELLAVEDGYRESTDSWATVLRDLKCRGLRAPLVAVGDSALGFWAAVGTVWAETREQGCWVHYADLRIMPTSARDARSTAGFAATMSA